MDESESTGFALFHVRCPFLVTSKRGLRNVKRLHSRICVLSLTEARPSCRAVALRWTQPLKEMSISWNICILRGKGGL